MEIASKEIARKLLGFITEENWNPKSAATNKSGEPVAWYAEDAASFCFVGAVYHLFLPPPGETLKWSTLKFCDAFIDDLTIATERLYPGVSITRLSFPQAHRILFYMARDY